MELAMKMAGESFYRLNKVRISSRMAIVILALFCTFV